MEYTSGIIDKNLKIIATRAAGICIATLLRIDHIFNEYDEAGITDQDKFYKLLQLLAGQTGNLVNRNDLSRSVEADNKTIGRYLYILRFWRTTDQHEIDFIVQKEPQKGKAVEVKVTCDRVKSSTYQRFKEQYPTFPVETVSHNIHKDCTWALKI